MLGGGGQIFVSHSLSSVKNIACVSAVLVGSQSHIRFIFFFALFFFLFISLYHVLCKASILYDVAVVPKQIAIN